MSRVIFAFVALMLMAAPCSAGDFFSKKLGVIARKNAVTAYNTVDMSRGFENDSDPTGWTETDAGSKLNRYDTAQAYQDTHSMSVTVDGDSVTAYQTYDTGSTHSSMSMSFWYYANTISGGTAVTYRIGSFSSLATGGSYNCAAYYGIAGADTYIFRFRGSSYPATTIGATSGNWYRVEMQCNQNATSTMSVYDTAGSQVGSTISLTANNNNQRYAVIGQHDASAASYRYTTYTDAIGVDWTDATNPLWPFIVEN